MKKIAAAVAIAGIMTATLTACAAGVDQGASASHAGIPQAAPGAFAVSSVRLQGPNYTVDVPQVTGGSDAARTEFNDAMRALAQTWIDRADATTTLQPGYGQVTYTGTRVVSGLLVVSVYSEGAAHPNNSMESHVTNGDTGRAITLADLFTDVQAGLNLLAEQAAIEVPKTRAGDTYFKSGIEATEFNYRLWLATPGGMEIHFGEIASHAAGDIVITVPWSKLDSALKPGIRDIVAG
ncbi:RsiV family protein [Nocardia arizonensis]|uniref:RsiV family protein n=1 Tax=Nocardia arizonensis TaxID=1141647 RepID=UPI0006D11D5C|nr:RsiV family protein [Nocardia arizonensis]